MEAKQRLLRLFEYLKELNGLKYPVINDINSQEWIKPFDEIPAYGKYVELHYMDRAADEQDEFPDEETTDMCILKVIKPELERAPRPPEALKEWLLPGWDNFESDAQVRPEITKTHKEQVIKIGFTDDPQRPAAFAKWHKERTEWAVRQKEINRVRKLFEELYKIYSDLKRDSDNLELMVGQGFLKTQDAEGQTIHHPLLLKRVVLQFEPQHNVMMIKDSDMPPELYASLLQKLDFINFGEVRALKKDLEDKFYHPLDRNDAVDYLERVAHSLHADRVLIKDKNIEAVTERLLIYLRPVLFMRKRTGGVFTAIEEIMEDINESDYLPDSLMNIIGVQEKDEEEETGTEEKDFASMIAALNGEDERVLLSKEANLEQLEIARRIEDHNAVLVQGPPGTGKTHTIANLMGHFLAQGKSILVTSHTAKALRVLKEKVVDDLKPLCVSVLDDNNRDMERSVDGITDYLSRYTPEQLALEIEKYQQERGEVLAKLRQERKRLFEVRSSEYKSIALDGKEYTPSEAAKFIRANQEEAAWIPGQVKLYEALPLTTQELISLYKTNEIILPSDEKELNLNLPNPEGLIYPSDFEKLIALFHENENAAKENSAKFCNLRSQAFVDTEGIKIGGKPLWLSETSTKAEKLEDLLAEAVQVIGPIQEAEEWKLHAILDGKQGGGFKKKWTGLIEKIQNTLSLSESSQELLLGKEILLEQSLINNETITALTEMREHFQKGKKINDWSLFWNRDWKELIEQIKINNSKISSEQDCAVVINYIKLAQARKEMLIHWKSLITENSGPDVEILDHDAERICHKYIDVILFCIEWSERYYKPFEALMKEGGLDASVLFSLEGSPVNILEEIRKIHTVLTEQLPLVLTAKKAELMVKDVIPNRIEENIRLIKKSAPADVKQQSEVCGDLLETLKTFDPAGYSAAYEKLQVLYNKYSSMIERNRLLEILERVAPDWTYNIRNRVGVHGQGELPGDLAKAWLWRQLNNILEELTSVSLEDTQRRIDQLTTQLRTTTSRLIEKMAWKHLLERMEDDLEKRQALQGWKLTVKKIGKGTGKRVPELLKEAKRLMGICQTAVPAWIMPINKALETLDPKVNKFDVVIIDEASQSDIAALTIMYLAKKIVVVGDNEQVSPLAVGESIDQVSSLIGMYLQGAIPNHHLYEFRTSIYDIALTTFSPICLKEHFRCIPEIIQFSNLLSYNGKILPLRDSSSVLMHPATVAYRVNGMREGEINHEEAITIASFIKTCIEQPEYTRATFGVISMQGERQAIYIDNLLRKYLAPMDYEERQILCGNPSQFQGDERNVVFLSVVYANDSEGPLRKLSEGTEGMNKKRFNVAASRAKDQLWVVHSLDPDVDLQNGDLRKLLIEHAQNPEDKMFAIRKMLERAESPFEEAVMQDLIGKGYHIVSQWQVGAYRIDMVAIYHDKKIAIECDGERFHDGTEQIKEDMQRQAVLERLGWKFIRIRGSEYYKAPGKTINNVIENLNLFGILPEENKTSENEGNNSELLEKIKARAAQIRLEWEALEGNNAG